MERMALNLPKLEQIRAKFRQEILNGKNKN